MSTPKLTPWFGGNVKPEREGVYERRMPIGGSTAFWFFNGEFWSYGGTHRPLMPHDRNHASSDQCMQWRGLAADPKAKP